MTAEEIHAQNKKKRWIGPWKILQEEFKGIRTGRATPGLVEKHKGRILWYPYTNKAACKHNGPGVTN